MKVFVALVILCLCVSIPTSAQDTATLFGTVTDITGGVLNDVRIEVVGPVLRTTVTGADGAFEISGLSPGTYNVTAVRAGFAVYEETLEVDGTRRELPIELPLSPFTQFVETVSRVVEEQAEAPFLVTQVQAEELRETAAVTLDEALRKVSGLQHATQGNAYTRVATRGFRDTRDVLVLLDGAPFRQLSGNADLMMIPVSMLQGVEFVKGSTSSVYGRGGVAGAMQFFTVPEATPTPSGEVVYGVGSFNTHEGQASVNLPYRAVSTPLRQPSSAFTVATPRW